MPTDPPKGRIEARSGDAQLKSFQKLATSWFNHIVADQRQATVERITELENRRREITPSKNENLPG